MAWERKLDASVRTLEEGKGTPGRGGSSRCLFYVGLVVGEEEEELSLLQLECTTSRIAPTFIHA